MPIHQHRRSMQQFGRDMRRDDPGFSARVARFEACFGAVDENRLAVLAQAAYYCWFEVEYARDFAEVCRAIGTGRPTTLYLCHQVTPTRWDALHTYVVGVQRWLGVDVPVPLAVDAPKVAQIAAWLGEQTPMKAALACLYLRRLCGGVSRFPLSVLIGDEEPTAAEYADYTAWCPEMAESVQYQQAVRQHSITEEIEELMRRLLDDGQPGCMHRYTRYQDIQITSIGALRWRGAVPSETDAPKDAGVQYFDQAVPAIEAWCRRETSTDSIGAALQAALGDYADWKAAIITDCLLARKDDLNTAFYDWTTTSTSE